MYQVYQDDLVKALQVYWWNFPKLQPPLQAYLKTQNIFTIIYSEREVRRIHRRFVRLDKVEKGHVSSNDMRSVLKQGGESEFIIFKFFDNDEDGFINDSDLYNIIQILVGKEMQEQSIIYMVQLLIQQYDIDQDKKLSYNEFKQLLRSVNNENNQSFDQYNQEIQENGLMGLEQINQ
ncbi:hypothetical protein PPERSA_12307 [Pseudocohnilembus persalinus]|uniref:EF-hand domain-containing protein n=1 Tax=Pseudocohnilembus persalinus TaxID=266149 RepID=A0A0V0R518_PSEPJ|nr:hypothetical protein PPERSA_12307 [Pseudocohnilembus persalinus]|eukprot:KRX09564.1 hypothetical protein PPERSA_12307 [Pseudocohnilembus persalinus]